MQQLIPYRVRVRVRVQVRVQGRVRLWQQQYSCQSQHQRHFWPWKFDLVSRTSTTGTRTRSTCTCSTSTSFIHTSTCFRTSSNNEHVCQCQGQVFNVQCRQQHSRACKVASINLQPQLTSFYAIDTNTSTMNGFSYGSARPFSTSASMPNRIANAPAPTQTPSTQTSTSTLIQIQTFAQTLAQTKTQQSPNQAEQTTQIETKTQLQQQLLQQQQRRTKSNEELIEIGRAVFTNQFNFPLDDWQLMAGGAIVEGYHVVICTPTGSGKTVIGSMALQYTLSQGMNGIYTTPLKALTNQIFYQLGIEFGPRLVSLSTGDMSINTATTARINVVTTEVYRNRAWDTIGLNNNNNNNTNNTNNNRNKSNLLKNGVLILDEFHFMADPDRGGVWEECIITCPKQTQIIALSATLPNGQQLSNWIQDVTNRQCLYVNVSEDKRIVPLRYLFATKDDLVPLFNDPDAGPGSMNGLLGFDRHEFHEHDINHTSTKDDENCSTLVDKEQKLGNINNTTTSNSSDTRRRQQRLPLGLLLNPVLQEACNDRIEQAKVTLNTEIENKNSTQTNPSNTTDIDDNNNNNDNVELVRTGKQRMSAKLSHRLNKLLIQQRRKIVPKSIQLIRQLEEKQLLPAIYFVFSKQKCNEKAASLCRHLIKQRIRTTNNNIAIAMNKLDDMDEQSNTQEQQQQQQQQQPLIGDSITHICQLSKSLFDDLEFYYSAGLLESLEQVTEVANRIQTFNRTYPQIAFDTTVIQHFLLGVGTHHAAMLPAHKVLVEQLYQQQLMKVVFATETLAAGIHMPARTTIISAMTKPISDSDWNVMDTHALLQMAGRAGRRGFDSSGTCVIAASPFDDETVSADVLTNSIRPVPSSLSPNYSLAILMIERSSSGTNNNDPTGTSPGSFTVARQLLSKSFDVWQRKQRLDQFQYRHIVNSEIPVQYEIDRFLNASIEIKAWTDFIAITKTLIAYNCVVPTTGTNLLSHRATTSDMKQLLDTNLNFNVTSAGAHVSQLRVENPLWLVIAMGGTFDVNGVSTEWDSDRYQLDLILNDENDGFSISKMESTKLINHLLSMSASEMAGYVASIVPIRSLPLFSSEMDIHDNDQGLTTSQQKALKYVSAVQDRLEYIQDVHGVNPLCGLINIDVSICEVATAWANGCSWKDALLLSGGMGPGDLSAALRKVMIVLRQLGNLANRDRSCTNNNNVSLHWSDQQSSCSSSSTAVPNGIHPDILKICKSAHKLVSRFPIIENRPF